MKNIDSPTPEKFVLTFKKKRMIKAFMKEFIRSKSYEVFISNGKYIPACEDYESFLLERLMFLKKIKIYLMIETINFVWTGLTFQYKDEIIYVETKAREELFSKININWTVKIQ